MYREITEALKKDGIYEVDGFLSEGDVMKIALEVESKQGRSSNLSGYCDIRHIGNDVKNAESFKIIKIKELFDVMRRISEEDNLYKVMESDNLMVTRLLIGRDGNKESNSFHYDSFYLTALIGIKTPSNESASGGLIVVNKLRGNAIGPRMSFLQKVIIQNRISKKIISLLVRNKLIKSRTISLSPGKLLVFFGARTLHASDIYPDGNRITLLLHTGLPNNKYKKMSGSGFKLKLKNKIASYQNK